MLGMSTNNQAGDGMPLVTIVRRINEPDGTYVFVDQDQAQEFHDRAPDTSTITTEVLMNGSAGAQFLIDTNDEDGEASA